MTETQEITGQACNNLSEGTTHFEYIKTKVIDLVNRWNGTHTKQLEVKPIWDACFRIFKYHPWIKVADIEPTFDLGLMGEFGENMGLNSEVIFMWFRGFSARKRKETLAEMRYNPAPTTINWDERKKTRNELIDRFMKFYNEYRETKVVGNISPFVPVFYTWFKKLKYITISPEEESKLIVEENHRAEDLRAILRENRYKGKMKTKYDVFMEAFTFAADNKHEILNQLKQMEL